MRRTRLKPRSKKRQARDRLLATVKRQLWARCNGHCEVPWCKEQAHDAHHVTKRSAGGDDSLVNLVALCRLHHDLTDYERTSRLLILKWRTKAGEPPGYGFLFDDPARSPAQIGPFTLEA